MSYSHHTGTYGQSPLFRSLACYQLAAFLRSDATVAEAYEFSIETFEAAPFWREGWGPEDDLRSVATVLASGASIVACSLYLWNSEQIHGVVRALKRVAPHITFIAGGPEVFDRPDFARTFPEFDILIEGDGGIPLREVLLRLRDPGADLSGIANVSFVHQGRWTHNPSVAAATDASRLPPFLADHADLIHGRGYYLSVRGCPKGCAYCLWARQPMQVKRRERVLQDLDTLLASPRLTGLTIVDYDVVELYHNDPELYEGIARLRKTHGEGNRLSFFVSPQNMVDPAVGLLFEKLGIDTMVIGLQSGSEEALAAVNRRWATVSLDLFEQVPVELRARFRVELIFPLPGETPQGFLDTVRRLLALGYGRLRIFNLLVLRGSKLHRDREALGLKALPRPPYLCFETPQVSLDDFLRFSVFARAITLLGNVADDDPAVARDLSTYCRAHPKLADQVLAAVTAGQSAEASIAGVAHAITLHSSSPLPELEDSPLAALGRLVAATYGSTPAGEPVSRPEGTPERAKPAPLPYQSEFDAFFAARSIPVVRTRRAGATIVFELDSGRGPWSISLGPRSPSAPSFQSTRFYDVAYSGEHAVVAVVGDFVRLVRSLESRSRRRRPRRPTDFEESSRDG